MVITVDKVVSWIKHEAEENDVEELSAHLSYLKRPEEPSLAELLKTGKYFSIFDSLKTYRAELFLHDKLFKQDLFKNPDKEARIWDFAPDWCVAIGLHDCGVYYFNKDRAEEMIRENYPFKWVTVYHRNGQTGVSK